MKLCGKLVFGGLVLISLSVTASAQIISGAELEPERVKPQAKVKLPEIQTTPDTVDYFFEPRPGQFVLNGSYPIVHMRIPKYHYFEKNSPSGPAREYNLYIHMFYPDFSGYGDHENSVCFKRYREGIQNGLCHNEMVVGFGFWPDANPSSKYAEYKDFKSDVAHGFIKITAQQSSYHGLILAGISGAEMGPYAANRETYYVGEDNKKQPAYVIRCSEYVPSPACDVQFLANKSPHIFIKLHFPVSFLPQWHEVISATRSKIDSMILESYSIQTKE